MKGNHPYLWEENLNFNAVNDAMVTHFINNNLDRTKPYETVGSNRLNHENELTMLFTSREIKLKTKLLGRALLTNTFCFKFK